MRLNLLVGAALAAVCGCVSRPEAAIGVFDSGTGGITVLEKLLVQDAFDNATGRPGADGIPDFAGERFTFFADSANMSYGVYPSEGKADYLTDLAKNDARFVVGTSFYRSAAEKTPTGEKPPAKIVVIGCNTATAYGLSEIRKMLSGTGIEVVGVINAGSKAALDAVSGASEPCAIGVMATLGTISSGAYERTLREEIAARGLREEIVIVNQPGYGLSEAVDKVADFLDASQTSPRRGYKGPTLGCGKGLVDPALLERYAFDRTGNGLLVRTDATGRITELQLNSAKNYVRFNLLSLLEQLRAKGRPAPLKAIVLGCTHFPYLTDLMRDYLRELRARPEYRDLIAPDLQLIDPAVYTAREAYRVLREQKRLAGKGDMSVEAYISVPDADLPADKIGKDGRLTYAFRYSRNVGDPRGTKEVPFSSANIDAETQGRLREKMPVSFERIRHQLDR